MSELRAQSLAACLAMALAPAALAMNDPTRPPVSFTEHAVAVYRAPPVLQSVIIGKNVRAAIIDGERVEMGGRYRDAQVVRIAEDEVVLRQDGLTQVLRMYPDVEKKTVRTRETLPQKPPPRGKAP